MLGEVNAGVGAMCYRVLPMYWVLNGPCLWGGSRELPGAGGYRVALLQGCLAFSVLKEEGR